MTTLIILSIIKLIWWLLLVPFFIGVLFNGSLPLVRRTFGITFLLGYLIYFAIFEVIAIPCMLHYVYNAFSVWVAEGYCALCLAYLTPTRVLWLLHTLHVIR